MEGKAKGTSPSLLRSEKQSKERLRKDLKDAKANHKDAERQNVDDAGKHGKINNGIYKLNSNK